ncbi:MAG: hypothetical protein IJX89_00540 [Alphaproteobacteria bacterium]|nr:hypothetical protein [Alphaproteobacteria bacterium]
MDTENQIDKGTTLQQRNAEYYAHNKQTIIQRSKNYYQKNKQLLRPKRRTYEKNYREKHKDYIKQRKHIWDTENAQACKEYAAKRYRIVKEMTQRAAFVCPSFVFLSQVRKTSIETYKLAYGQNERVIPKIAKLCPALEKMSPGICPLVRRDFETVEQMTEVCPMKRAFLIPRAADAITQCARTLREQMR